MQKSMGARYIPARLESQVVGFKAGICAPNSGIEEPVPALAVQVDASGPSPDRRGTGMQAYMPGIRTLEIVLG